MPPCLPRGIPSPSWRWTATSSLPASLEILAWARQRGLRGARVISLASPDALERLRERRLQVSASRTLAATRVGIVGAPSDWLIASHVDYHGVALRWGIEFEPVAIEEVLDEVRAQGESERMGRSEVESLAARLCGGLGGRMGEGDLLARGEGALRGAMGIYLALRELVARHRLTALTVRCFDLIGPLAATGCLALSLLNDDGVVAGCEGDVPALFTMLVNRIVTGEASFMANPSVIRGDDVLFAHCTVPVSMTTCCSLDTHFESGKGLAVRGSLPRGPLTVSRVGGETLARHLVLEGEAVQASPSSHHCRTQVLARVAGLGEALLSRPLGNHHVLVPGHHRRGLEAVLGLGGSVAVESAQE